MSSRVAAWPLIILALAGCAHTVSTAPPAAPDADLRALSTRALDTAAARYLRSAQALDPAAGIPRATRPDGAWHSTKVNDWTSGFFPGTLWMLHATTGRPELRAQAERWTLPLAAIPQGSYSHDLGFQFLSSFGNAYRVTGDTAWRTPALGAARLLAARFNPTVGAIKSWDFMPATRPYPVIADNMMNLELLFWGARQPGGDPAWRDIALRHARTTIANHIRPDGGSFHVVIFDPATGNVLERITHQGLADSTTWARGQAWLTYGFTMAYRESRAEEFLGAARRLAAYSLARLPADGVPCWDYQAPGCPDTASRDASAGAITASALIELSTFVPPEEAQRYQAAAERILTSLAGPKYLAAPPMQSLLAHSMGNRPAGTEIDVGINYADYYFVEALLRWRELRGGNARPEFLLRSMPPRTQTLRGELLYESRERLRRGDATLAPALRQLLMDADSALDDGPFTVMAKTRVPPSGDRHDYMSFGPYWWPDSTKPDGLPYVRRDGQVNWDLRRQSDALRLYPMIDATETLALAWYFSRDPKYAERAALLLRTWFVDSATRMNPHLRFGQAIPGVTEGRGIGIIDTRDLGRVTDAVALLEGSNAWSGSDENALRSWMASYLQWLRTSEHGIDEQDELNNHGTWYDLQIASLAAFLGDTALLRNVVTSSVTARIAAQIDSAGRQPLELARTRSLHYSVENLDAFTRLAELARLVQVDLWSWQAPAGGSIRRALAFLAPYADPGVKWPHEQITREATDLFARPLRRAAAALRDDRYGQAFDRLDPAVRASHRSLLLYPPHPPAPGTGGAADVR